MRLPRLPGDLAAILGEPCGTGLTALQAAASAQPHNRRREAAAPGRRRFAGPDAAPRERLQALRHLHPDCGARVIHKKSANRAGSRGEQTIIRGARGSSGRGGRPLAARLRRMTDGAALQNLQPRDLHTTAGLHDREDRAAPQPHRLDHRHRGQRAITSPKVARARALPLLVACRTAGKTMTNLSAPGPTEVSSRSSVGHGRRPAWGGDGA